MKRYLCIFIIVASVFLAGCGETNVSDDDLSESFSDVQLYQHYDDAEPEVETFDPLDIPTHSVVSTCFSEIGYDVEREILLVCFRESGTYYCYYDIPYDVYCELDNAKSIGGYYNSEIKGNYTSERLTF